MTLSEHRSLEQAAMARALELALRGPSGGANPQVGCVLLSPEGEVLAEGWHRGAGTPHAEVDALSKLSEGGAQGATAIVTLEPCNHTGRTGPCAVALIEAGVARVVYAVPDPGEASAAGADRLRAAGVDVEQGLGQAAVEHAIAPWLTAMRRGRPWVIVKWGTSLDGRAAAADGTSQWITGPEARADVHRRRSEAGAIVVGTGTVLADDPTLTARTPEGDLYESQPVPVVIGARPVPDAARLHAHPQPLRVYPDHDLEAVLSDLHSADIRTVFVEGGPTLASAVIAAGLADEYLIYLAPMLLGGPRMALGEIGVPSIEDARRLEIVHHEQLGHDLLLIARPA